MIPTISKIKSPRTSYIRFFFRKSVTLPLSQIITTPPITIAVAITQKTSVKAIAPRIESKEKIKFMTIIEAIIIDTDFGFASI